ncbi:MAG: hypothetical protein ACR5K2_01180 [Wolbachia sp.]
MLKYDVLMIMERLDSSVHTLGGRKGYLDNRSKGVGMTLLLIGNLICPIIFGITTPQRTYY